MDTRTNPVDSNFSIKCCNPQSDMAASAASLLSFRTYNCPKITMLPARLRSFPISTTMAAQTGRTSTNHGHRKLPILLFDVMDTIVRDPFYHDVPAFFGMSFTELIECKHPTSWIEFEEGRIDEMELERNFFKDGRPFDMEGLKNCMRRGYSYLNGVEELLKILKQNGYEMHACTNYPTWYKMIEDKLKLSAYLSWTFCSCKTGRRKPDPAFYADISSHLNVDPERCIFIDDRLRNAEAATEAGMVGLEFKNADLLQQNLCNLGVLHISPDQDNNNNITINNKYLQEELNQQ